MLCLRISRDFPPPLPVICGKIGKTTLIGQTKNVSVSLSCGVRNRFVCAAGRLSEKCLHT